MNLQVLIMEEAIKDESSAYEIGVPNVFEKMSDGGKS